MLKTDNEILKSDIKFICKTTNVPICPSQDPALWEINSDMIDILFVTQLYKILKQLILMILFVNVVNFIGSYHVIFSKENFWMVKSKIDNDNYTQLQKMHHFIFTDFYFLIKKTQFSSTDSGFTDWKKMFWKSRTRK